MTGKVRAGSVARTEVPMTLLQRTRVRRDATVLLVAIVVLG